MRTGAMVIGLVVLVVVAAVPCAAQTSASYKMTEHAFNAAGNPLQGGVPGSASYHMSLDAVGDAALNKELTSTSYRSEGGFVQGFEPAEEVRNIRFKDKTTLSWTPEESIGVYNVYRGYLPDLQYGDAGTCFAPGLAAEQATDTATPTTKAGYFYLVTAENRLAEEGTMGSASSGLERFNDTPCP